MKKLLLFLLFVPFICWSQPAPFIQATSVNGSIILSPASGQGVVDFEVNGAGLTNLTTLQGYWPNGRPIYGPVRLVWCDETFTGDADVNSSFPELYGLVRAGKIILEAVITTSGNYTNIAYAQINCNYRGLNPMYGYNTEANGSSPGVGASPEIITNYPNSFNTGVGGSFFYTNFTALADYRVMRLVVMRDTNRPPVFVFTGQANSYAAFLTSPADDISPLTGAQMEAAGLVQAVILEDGFYPSTSATTVNTENNARGTAAYWTTILSDMQTNCLHIYAAVNTISAPWTATANVQTLGSAWFAQLTPDDPCYFGWTNYSGYNTSGRAAWDPTSILIGATGGWWGGSNYFQYVQGSNWYDGVDVPLFGSNVFTPTTAYNWWIFQTNAPGVSWAAVSNLENQLIVTPVPAWSAATEQPFLSPVTSLNAYQVSTSLLVVTNMEPMAATQAISNASTNGFAFTGGGEINEDTGFSTPALRIDSTSDIVVIGSNYPNETIQIFNSNANYGGVLGQQVWIHGAFAIGAQYDHSPSDREFMVDGEGPYNTHVQNTLTANSAVVTNNLTANATGLSYTFNGVSHAVITGTSSGVTNTSTNYGTVKVIATGGIYSNFDAAGNWLDTNNAVPGQEEWPVGPGAGIKSASAGITSCKIIFQ